MTNLSLIPNLSATVAVATCLGLAACGKADPGMMGSGGSMGTGGTGVIVGDGGMGDPSQLLPLKTGNFWTYLVTDETGVPTPKTQTVMEEGPVGGTGPNRPTTSTSIGRSSRVARTGRTSPKATAP